MVKREYDAKGYFVPDVNSENKRPMIQILIKIYVIRAPAFLNVSVGWGRHCACAIVEIAHLDVLGKRDDHVAVDVRNKLWIHLAAHIPIL